MSIASLDLDLDLFSGPFDLLLTLVLREEIDLLELQLAEVVLAYLDHLEARGELDLESATEFIVLLAALLELKSRLMLAGEEDEPLLDLEPGEAAEELLQRMLDARRYRSAAAHLRELLARETRRALPLRARRPRTCCARLPARGRRGRARPGGARPGDRPAAGDAARDLPAPHRDPARVAHRAPLAPAHACCAAGASPSTRRSRRRTA